LKEILSYDPLSGIFTWNKCARPELAGKIAGFKTTQGYIRITINRKFYPAQNLAWFYVTGSLPEHIMDHRNRVRDDNRFSNLRQANDCQNAWNISPRKSREGRKGVTWGKKEKRWIARIQVNNKNTTIGYFKTAEEAAHAYQVKARELHGEFASF
jgi:hypothetical protein